jgi:hypothetical protein
VQVELLELLMLVQTVLLMDQIQFSQQSHLLVEVKVVKKSQMVVMADQVVVQVDQAHQVGQVILLQ